MIPELIELYQLAFSSYVYTNMTGYDRTYKELVDNTGNRVNLYEVQHRRFIIKWLNSWGCRQFALEYHNQASKSILEWYKRFANKIIASNKDLLMANEQDISDVCESYEALSRSFASYREGQIRVNIGPTGAAKLLFALRPKILPPWDHPIRRELGFDGRKESYERFLYHTKKQLNNLSRQCEEHGFHIQDLPKKLGREDVTLPKLIDEYYWLVITKKVIPPDRSILKGWYEFSIT